MNTTDLTKNLTVEELLDRIRREQASFSSSQRLVANYVIENYFQIPFLSITALAKNIGVSNSTVINFCNLLGYNKFAEFKKVFSNFAHSELVMFNKLIANTPPDLCEGDFMQKEMRQDLASIEATLSSAANRAALQSLLPMIDRAEHIYIVGGRSSAILAALFATMLRYLGLKVQEIDLGSSDHPDRIATIGRQDLVIAISLPRYTAQCISALKLLHDRNIPIALLTDMGLSPACEFADTIFSCSVTSDFYFPCTAGCLSLISAICRAVSATRKTSALSHIRQLEQTLIDEGIFI